ncbi:flavin reductase family protein [Altericista sp. CCNU0014]|uniref:flavin reductase family protein n=1 Tax=Altericista sp. CCNU0014 TaxID=3082949 RepID=UPI00384CE74B
MSSSIFNFANPELYAITAAHAGQTSGQITTWVTLGALVPEHLRVVATISPQNFTFGLIRNSQRFIVNLLAEGQQDWLPLFGLRSTREVNKFEGILCETTADGIPILPETCGWAECQIVQEVDLGDRVIVIADVLNHQVNESRKPLCRAEAMAALPPEVRQALAQKRLLDIECDRALLQAYQSRSATQ